MTRNSEPSTPLQQPVPADTMRQRALQPPIFSRRQWEAEQAMRIHDQLSRLRTLAESDDVPVSHPFDVDVLSAAAHGLLPETGFSTVLASLRSFQQLVRRGRGLDPGEYLKAVLESATAIAEFIDEQLLRSEDRLRSGC